MRYFFISDVHSFYTKMKKALDENNFNPEKDTLINLGDSFDRGNEIKEVLSFLINLPHKILIWGNHDYELFLLLKGIKKFTSADIHNGTFKTWNEINNDPEMQEMIEKYFSSLYNAVDFPNEKIVATHGWLPHNWKKVKDIFRTLDPEKIKASFWKNKDLSWYDATWNQTALSMMRHERIRNRKLIIGHWSSFDLKRLDGQKKYTEDLDTSIFYSNDEKIIGIDGTAALDEGRVNVFILETDDEPVKY